MSDTVFCLITWATISHRYEDDHWEHWGCFSKLSLDVTSKDLHCWRWLEEDPPVLGLVGAGLGWVRVGGGGQVWAGASSTAWLGPLLLRVPDGHLNNTAVEYLTIGMCMSVTNTSPTPRGSLTGQQGGGSIRMWLRRFDPCHALVSSLEQ